MKIKLVWDAVQEDPGTLVAAETGLAAVGGVLMLVALSNPYLWIFVPALMVALPVVAAGLGLVWYGAIPQWRTSPVIALATVIDCRTGQKVGLVQGECESNLVFWTPFLWLPLDSNQSGDAVDLAVLDCMQKLAELELWRGGPGNVPPQPISDPAKLAPVPPLVWGEQELEVGSRADGDGWFALSLPPGSRLKVDAEFDPARGDVDLALHGPRGRVVATSRSAGPSEAIDLVVTEPGDYRLHVYVGGGATTPTPCRLKSELVSLPLLRAPQRHHGRLGSAEGQRWYGFLVEAGQVVRFDLLFSHSRGDLDLELVTDQGESLAVSASMTDGEALEIQSDVDFAVYARVNCNGSSGPYELRVEGR